MATRLELLRKSPITKNAIDAVFLRNKQLLGVNEDEVMREPYRKSDLVYICISTTAKAISQVPLVVVRNFGSKGEYKPLPDSDPWSQLFSRPNYITDRYSFVESVITHLLHDGEVFIIPYPPGLNPPGSLWVVRNKFIRPMKDPKTNLLLGWLYNQSGQFTDGGVIPAAEGIPLHVDEVARIYLFNPYDPLKGMSPLEAGKMSIVVDYKASFYTSVFFDEGASPGGVISTEQKLGDKQFSRTREQFEARHQGFKKAHRIAVLEQGLKYTQTGLTQKDMEFGELRKLTAERIYQIFGMKKAVVSVMEDINYACIPATERVYTVDKGGISIADVESGDYVWSLGENGPEKSKVVASWYQGKKKIYQLNTRNYKLRASYDHPVLVLQKKVDGFFKLPKHKYEGELIWKPMAELKRGDFVVVSKGLSIGEGEEVDLEFCKFSGAFTGDGSISQGPGAKLGFVSLAIPEEKKELRDVYSDLMTNLSQYKKNLKTRWGHSIRKGDSVIINKERFGISCYGTLVDRLFQLDMVKDSHNKRIPQFVWDSGKEGALEFIKGYMDTDGSIYKSGQCDIGSCNEELMKDTACLLDYLGILHGPVNRIERDTNFGHQIIFSISIGNPTEIGSDDPSDITRIAKLKSNKYKTKLEYASDLGIATKALPNGFTVAKATSVEEFGEEDVYDLEVEGRHNFICNNIVVHNTSREEIKLWWEGTNIPLMSLVTSALNFIFFRQGSDLKLIFDVTTVTALKEALKEKIETGYKMWQMGFTANEINQRLDMGFNSKPWRDVAFVPVNLQPVDRALNPPKPTVPALPPAPPAEPPPKPPKALGEGERIKESGNDAKNEQSWNNLIEKTKGLEEKFEKKVTRVFADMRKRSLSNLYKNIKAPKDLDDENFPEDSRNISRFTDPIYEEALIVGFTTLLDDIGSSMIFNLSDPEALAFLSMKNIEIKGIIQTIKDQIRVELMEAYEKGETIDQIADRIRSVFNASVSRAKTIARTEIIGTANAGRNLAIGRSGFKEKEWFTAMDEKVRLQHRLQHGKTVKVGNPWVMADGSSLRYPGDPQGPAHQVISCRCVEIIVPDSHYLINE